MHTTFVRSNLDKEKLTVAEFRQLQSDAIKAYNSASWMLADILSLGKQKYGRTQLMELTPLTLTKVQWFISISSVTKRNPELLVDHHFEVAGNPKASYWLNKAEKEKLNPLQLRVAIRKENASFKKTPSLKNVAEYPKHLDFIEREFKRMTPEERQRAKEYLANKISSL